MILEQSTAPSVEPVSQAEAQLWARIEHESDDAIVDSLIEAARNTVEVHTQRQLITATWKLYLLDFHDIIRLPRSPLQSVTSIAYVDTNGDAQTVDTSVYSVDTKIEPGAIFLAYGQTWPIHRAANEDRVTVTYKAGYGDAATAVPEALKTAIKMLLVHWYDTGHEPVAMGVTATSIPWTVDSLLSPYVVGYEF